LSIERNFIPGCSVWSGDGLEEAGELCEGDKAVILPGVPEVVGRMEVCAAKA